MTTRKAISSAILSILIVHSTHAQHLDSTKNISRQIDPNSVKLSRQDAKTKNRFPLKPLSIPGLMIAYGFTSLENDGLKNFNIEFKEEIYLEHPHKKFPIDNYLQFAPAVAVYGLNLMGVRGKHNLRDRSLIYTMSNIILTGTVYSIKKITAVQRPDGSAYTSFPSDHTAEALHPQNFFIRSIKMHHSGMVLPVMRWLQLPVI